MLLLSPLAKLHKHVAIQPGLRYQNSKAVNSSDARSLSYSLIANRGYGLTSGNQAFRPKGALSVSPSVGSSSGEPYLRFGNAPYKQLSTTEIKHKRGRDLCYYYEEKYTLTHRCKASYLLLIGEEEMMELLQGQLESSDGKASWPPQPTKSGAGRIRKVGSTFQPAPFKGELAGWPTKKIKNI